VESGHRPCCNRWSTVVLSVVLRYVQYEGAGSARVSCRPRGTAGSADFVMGSALAIENVRLRDGIVSVGSLRLAIMLRIQLPGTDKKEKHIRPYQGGNSDTLAHGPIVGVLTIASYE